jgi:hypothetical protein
VPGRLQSIGELAYEFIAGMVRENCGTQGMKYFPWVFSIFMFVLFGNFLGMIPYTYTFTSHIIVTFALALMVFLTVTVIAFARHGFHFFAFFLPEGTPLAMAPMVVALEILSYFIRPVSLSIRLFANMMAGPHHAECVRRLRDHAGPVRRAALRGQCRADAVRVPGRGAAGLCLHDPDLPLSERRDRDALSWSGFLLSISFDNRF